MSRGVTVDVSALNKTAELLQGFPAESGKALQRTLLRTKDRARTELARKIPLAYNVAAKDVRSALTKERRRFVSLVSGENSVSIEVIGKRLGAVRFRHRPVSVPHIQSAKKKKVVPQVQVLRSGQMKALTYIKNKSGQLMPVFMAPTGAQDGEKFQAAFFYRESARRTDMRSVRSLAIPQMLVHPQVSEPLLRDLTEAMGKTYEQQLNYELTKMGATLSQVKGGSK